MMPRFRLWPACSDVAVTPAGLKPRAAAPETRPAPPPLRPTVQNPPCTSSAGERSGGSGNEGPARTAAEEESRETRAADPAEAMPRAGGGGGSRASAKPHHRPRLRPRLPSPPAPSLRASAAAGAAAPEESKEASALEATVVSSVEETSFTFEFKRGFKRAKKEDSLSRDAPRGEDNSTEGLSNRNAIAVKTPTAKQGPEKVELTHCAPSIVARLMGLDTMPRPKKVLDRCQSDIRANRQRHLSGGVQEVARTSSGGQTRNASANELPALKDVFEVSEMENMAMHELSRSGNKKPDLRSSEADLEFVRQKFMDVKRLSADEAQRNSKEFSEALEVLHSKKDVFLEILQEKRTAVSGFSGNILNHSGLQDSHASSAATAAARSFEQEILCSMEDGGEGVFDAATDSEEPISNVLLKETSVTPFEPLEGDGCKRGSGHRSPIVVLKPNLRRKSFTPVLSSQEASQYDWRNGKQYVKSRKPGVMHSAPSNEASERGDIMRQRARKQTPKSCSRRRSSKEECKLAQDSERVKVASTSNDDTIPICSSTGSSMGRKARKHLSERWQTACQFGSENSNPRDIKTLGEILELSDRDATKKASSDPKSNHDNSRQVPASPLGISSKDGWKKGISCEDHSRGGISRNFPRSKSLPASSTSSTKLSGRRQSASTCRLPILKDILNTPTDESEHARIKKRSSIRNAKQKNGKAIVHAGKENMLPEKEIHVTSEKERHSICISDLPRAANTYTEYPGDVIRCRDHQASEFAVQHEQQNFKVHIGCSDRELTTSFPATEDNPIYHQDIIALKEGRNPSIEIDVGEDDTEAIESTCIASTEGCECSSPTALSQQSSCEYMSYSGFFNRVNVGIQGLREQLKMLKREDQDDTCGYYSDTFSSDECSNMNTSTYSVMEEQVPLFKDEEDRDFSYVQDMLDSVCDFPAYPEDWQVSSDMFLWLENKYNKLLLWSKSDRKLLFDLVNSVVADMTAPSSSLHSKILVRCWSELDRGHFAAYVWQMVQKLRYYEQVSWDCILPLPLDHHSELELIKMEVLKMIHDDIIEESIAEFMSKEK